MLIDSFLFFNETELVELRIKYLEKIVDYFVVVEANKACRVPFSTNSTPESDT